MEKEYPKLVPHKEPYERLKEPAERLLPIPEERDNWKHRSSGMKCKTCMWFVLKKKPIGRCRYNAPGSGQKMGFPAVFETDWCGQHKIDETKYQE